MAMESRHITADVIEVAEFPELVQKFEVRGVPKTIIDEKTAFEGALPEARFLAKIFEAAAIHG